MRRSEIVETSPHDWTVATMAALKVRLAASREARRASSGLNEPTDPDLLVAPFRVELSIDFDDLSDDARRIAAERWCLQNAEQRWFRRIDRRRQVVSFAFEHHLDATMFRLSH
jgi:hypothetical protein